ncbi:glycosyltransferase family 2 protein [Luteolibacter yonseiensis]|uniref:Glycosyltransferase family 2 protein n=2 Tax=Luteolibacter yonseiensis TaxID=1144680 RepID=A0A934R0C5_9BACT|nr:glycosyltransferase family 2 protein [Luteolibacter yonseiensis]MBK1814409.1 glycosyltransferase family 2 protein [Luteolibacter yonseiensis]
MNDTPLVTIVMPCLNEEETLATCIRKALQGIDAAGIRGEVLIADNGSSDRSPEIALEEGARIISVSRKGYGSALRAGIEAAGGKWILMGDADDSYDFSNITPFIEKLKEGDDLVMGCRMPRGGGRIAKGAMPWKHRWIGNPVLTFIGRLFFKCPANDFHCGLRAFTREGYRVMNLQTIGMEFASEMVIKATLAGLKISEVPITLHPDGRSRAPHLRSWRDGWRHLRFMLLFSPRWLFLMPGIGITGVGSVGLGTLAFGQMIFGKAVLDVGTMMVCSMFLLVGTQLLWLAVFTREFAVSQGFLPPNRRLRRVLDAISLEWGLVLGILMGSGGMLLLGLAFLEWQHAGFQGLSYSANMRRIIPASTLIILGIQFLFGSFSLGVLGLKTERRD